MKKLVDLYRVDNFIDTFALGHYARVLEAQDRRSGQSVAFKVMRPEHVTPGAEPRWEFRAFANEADLLMRLADSPHTVNLIDCGYVSAQNEAPVSGEIESFGKDVIGFTSAQANYCQRGWRPYLTLENLPRHENLFYQMRPDKAGLRLRLPTEEGLALALQFAETLKLAHKLNIAYLDHKLEHLYWDGIHLRIIDFNSSRAIDDKNAEHAQLMCMDVHNLCVGILYSIFTGLSPQKTTLRPQPGPLSEVEARYQDVNSLDFGVEPTLSTGAARTACSWARRGRSPRRRTSSTDCTTSPRCTAGTSPVTTPARSAETRARRCAPGSRGCVRGRITCAKPATCSAMRRFRKASPTTSKTNCGGWSSRSTTCSTTG